MSYQHQELANGRWREYSFITQLANIGSEVERAIKWKNKNNPEYFRRACNRMLELIDLTAADLKNRKRLKELLRAREMLVDYLIYDNQYNSTDRQWQKYFYYFTYLNNKSRF
ncbi:MAG: hypothetical protein PVG90_03740 [Bacillota bacterium]|jgi:hypothetical protein